MASVDITCANCGDTIALRDRVTRGWGHHAGPPVTYFCGKPGCNDAYRAFVEETKLRPQR
jgi:hypothetical protein